jgi:serine/threonine protein kinase
MRAYDTDLASWTKHINLLPEPARLDAVAAIFRDGIVGGLLEGLQGVREAEVVHGDVKPGNVLLVMKEGRRDGEGYGVPECGVIADFSSASFSSPLSPTSAISSLPPTMPLGGGTWDFLAPSLVRKNPAHPSPETDLYALALTILYVVIGGSVFDAAGSNVFLRREMVKMGDPLQFLGMGDEGVVRENRIRGLEERLGFGVWAWLGSVLGGKDGVGVDVGTWRRELEKGLGM